MADTLKNLQYMTINKGMKHIIGGDKMSHFPDMRIQDDSTLYAKLLEKKRSSFDRSKFTVVDNPVITDDGIASKFGNHTNRAINIPTFNTSTSNSWRIITEFEYDERNLEYMAILATQTGYSLFLCYLQDGFQLNLSSDNSSWNIVRQFVSKPSNTIRGDKLRAEINYNNNTYIISILNLRTNTTQKETITSSEKIQFLPNRIGNTRGSGGFSLEYGSIDLKQLSFTINEVEVFNGHKTGIDQIKKDNYEIVGSPIIDEYGSISNIGVSNYLTLPVNLNPQRTLKVCISGKHGGTQTVAGCLLRIFTSKTMTGDSTNWHIDLYRNRSSKMSGEIGYSSHIDYMIDSVVTTNNSNYYYEISINFANSTYSYKYFEDNICKSVVTEATASYLQQADFSKLLYVQLGGVWGNLNGSVDLNQYKIYVDDELVYQPTLRIPYTQSKTGYKIVDATYRDRVQDMHEQFGYTHYYTIGDVPEKYNVRVVGSPTLVGGAASGFSNVNYLSTIKIIDFNSANNWEVTCCFTTPENPEATNSIYSGKTSYNGLRIALTSANKIAAWFSSAGSSYNIGFITGLALNSNTKYWVKVLFSGTEYSLWYSLDGRKFTQTGSPINSTLKVKSATGLFGINDDINTAFRMRGIIHLSEASIIIDGKEVFRGYEPAITDAFTLATHKGTDIIDSYSDGEGTYYEVRADLVQRCVGIIPINTTEVNYPRGFRDAKNIVQVAYFNVGESTAGATINHISPKAQTKDGFTIGATTAIQRNYYAEGKAVLG